MRVAASVATELLENSTPNFRRARCAYLVHRVTGQRLGIPGRLLGSDTACYTEVWKQTAHLANPHTSIVIRN
jgi:hypothetical protein